mgnify:CR=1 FL=1
MLNEQTIVKWDKNTETDDLLRQESDQHGFSEQKHGDSDRTGLQLHLPAFLLPQYRLSP